VGFPSAGVSGRDNAAPFQQSSLSLKENGVGGKAVNGSVKILYQLQIQSHLTNPAAAKGVHAG
jgi:hypothetical protein